MMPFDCYRETCPKININFFLSNLLTVNLPTFKGGNYIMQGFRKK